MLAKLMLPFSLLAIAKFAVRSGRVSPTPATTLTAVSLEIRNNPIRIALAIDLRATPVPRHDPRQFREVFGARFGRCSNALALP